MEQHIAYNSLALYSTLQIVSYILFSLSFLCGVFFVAIGFVYIMTSDNLFESEKTRKKLKIAIISIGIAAIVALGIGLAVWYKEKLIYYQFTEFEKILNSTLSK